MRRIDAVHKSKARELHAESTAWHALPEDAIYRTLDTPADGLTDAESSQRQLEFGRNVLPAQKPPTGLAIFLHQFLSPLIYILLGAGVVAILMGDITDAGFILGVVLLNAALGTFQEWKAERSAASLQQLLQTKSRVMRNGVTVEISADELVPGDLVYLESGARVPADVRLLHTNNLTSDEALLTGESLPVEKRPGKLAEDLPVSDRGNMAFAGSVVASGRGSGVVVATGSRTEVGKIAGSVTATQTTKPPLVIRMEKFSRQVSVVVLVACTVLAGVAFGRGTPLLDVFLMAVALAVSAIPEGLPVAMTVALSIATNRMAKRNVIVRKLTAVEGLGSCTYIASDKTGTLTINKQTVKSVWIGSGDSIGVNSGEGLDSDRTKLERLCRTSLICNEAAVRREGANWQFLGDAVDVAFWDLALTLKMDPSSITEGVTTLGEIPFESERGYAAKFYLEDGLIRVAVKGAPEVLIDRCHGVLGRNSVEDLDRGTIEKRLGALTGTGHRVIAIAEGVEDP